MAVYKSSIIFLFFIGLSTLNASCGKRGEKEVKISSQVDTISFATSNKIDSKSNCFKKWLQDTLKTIDSSFDNKYSSWRSEPDSIYIDNDSLLLTIVKNYNGRYGLFEEKVEYKDVNSIVSTLSLSEETPNCNDIIVTRIAFLYSPSQSDSGIYELKMKVKLLKVIKDSGDKDIDYSIVNGRLDHKIVRYIVRDSVVRREYYDFLWDNGKLEKFLR